MDLGKIQEFGVSQVPNGNLKDDRLRASSSEESSEDSRKDRGKQLMELGCSFHGAVSAHDWRLAEKLLLSADKQTLDDALFFLLDSIWLHTTRQELHEINVLIKKVVNYGADKFARALINTCFLASYLSVCEIINMSIGESFLIFEQRMCQNHPEFRASEFTELVVKCTGLHTCFLKNIGNGSGNWTKVTQFQLSAFKTFLDGYGCHFTVDDFTEAFSMASLPVALFSDSFDSGWASETSTARLTSLFEMLVERGSDHKLSLYFVIAARCGHTELVRILTQVSYRKNINLPFDSAFDGASYKSKFATMKCLVEEGHVVDFLPPLLKAVLRGSMQVVKWFVEQGCKDLDLFRALEVATYTNQVEVAACLLPHVPQGLLISFGPGLLMGAADGSPEGVDFLLRNNILDDPAATYAMAELIAKDEDPLFRQRRTYLDKHWSEAAFAEGFKCGEKHFVNIIRVLRRGDSPICLRDLPYPLVTAIAYLQLYRQCKAAGGKLLPQRLLGELVEAASRLSGRQVDRNKAMKELLAILEHHLPPFFLSSKTNANDNPNF